MTKAKFDSTLASIKKRGAKVTNEFTSIVTTAVQLYYGETNRNIQVINDVMDCAKALKGIRVKALAEYFSKVIPHHKGADSLFGKMNQEAKSTMDNTWETFLIDNPVWHEFTVEKDVKPFDLIAFLKTIKNRIDTAHKSGTLDDNGLKTLKAEVSKFAFAEDDKPKI